MVGLAGSDTLTGLFLHLGAQILNRIFTAASLGQVHQPATSQAPCHNRGGASLSDQTIQSGGRQAALLCCMSESGGYTLGRKILGGKEVNWI